MKTVLTIAILALALNVQAGPSEKVRYWYSQNVSATVPPLDEIVQLQDNSDGQGIHYTWMIANPPTKETIQAVDNATAMAWSLGIAQDKTADYELWTDREKAFIKLMVKELNILRAEHGLNARTKAQVISALKAEI